MDNKNKKIISLCVFIIIVILIIVFISFDLSGNEKTLNMLLINEKGKNVVQNTEILENKNKVDDGVESATGKDDDKTLIYNSDIYASSNNNLEKDNIINSDNKNFIITEENDMSEVIKDDEERFVSEIDVVNYFKNINNEVEESNSFKEKFKEYFITVVDFIFYDKEINGYTFSELSGTAKAEIVSFALKIDNKIEEYVPNYKENVSSTSNKIYTGIKDKLVILYMDISTDICDNNEEGCNKVKEIFAEIKDGCKIGWNFIKGLFKGGFSKVKEWYEIYSGI